jgi:hypothetical protein
MTGQRTLKIKLVAAAFAVVATSLVWSGGTFSTFNKTSSMPGNSVGAGTVVLTDNDAGTSPLSMSDVLPGNSGTACVLVSYTGSAPATVRFYGAVGGTGLSPYLNFTVTRGTFSGTPAAGSCTGFTADTTGSVLYNGLLSAFPVTTGGAIADPASSWTSGDKRGYKLQWTMPSNVASAAQGKSASVDVTWQAVSS